MLSSISSFRLLRLSSATLPRRNYYSVLAPSEPSQPSSSDPSQTETDRQQSNSIEDYVTQLAGSSSSISSPVRPPQSTSQAKELIHIPANPGWAMRAHPELYDPPVLKPTHRIHVATLVIEAYNPEKEQLPLVAGFALQAAYHLGIPVTRPAAMPIKTELHTVLRSGFVHKKSQENFWRLTHRRVIKAYDANEEVINRWINYLRTDAVRGTNVALKAQRFLYRPIGWGKDVDELARRELELEQLEKPKSTNGRKKSARARANISSSSTQAELTQAEAVKALAERLIKEELIPKAEAHEAMLASTGTKDGKKMAELQIKDSDNNNNDK
ncbi:mitochondrial 37S ribosomal protein rsm10 [Puccinia graminis f. sp. tritici]|uniref:Small ribosomal subunit protein uS10m n=1 Tax=Puccinia graminis f. sp. tritici TaxID=56615 RepID=A0A5B0N557_PUCGR|nr:mitochondrial 37S ribosomal protein rsm10 [Puccinia graminis f. sp. tritici]